MDVKGRWKLWIGTYHSQFKWIQLNGVNNKKILDNYVKSKKWRRSTEERFELSVESDIRISI